MPDFESLAFNLSFMIVLINVMLFLGGYLSLSETQGISSVIIQVDLTDTNSQNYQNSLILQDSNHTVLTTQGTNFISQILDLLQKIPVLGPLISLALLFYDMILKATFGLSILMLKMGFPRIIQVPIAVTNFLIIGAGAYYFIKSLARDRGGLK